MNAHRIETIIGPDGTLVLSDIPFQPGEPVEVIILEKSVLSTSGSKELYPLHGTPLQYTAPTDPVAEEEWDTLG